jgi:cyanophycin synthetase
MKKLINNKYANFYLNAASTLGLNYKIINKKVGWVRIFNKDFELDISSNVLGINTQLSSSLSVNKAKTSTLLQETNIPVPNFKTFTDFEKAQNYAIKKLQHKKSIVVKPVSGSLSIGITVNPTSRIQIKKALLEAFEGNSSIMIEEYIAGNHFRITTLDGETIAITQRIPANVTGNGKDTVKELIEKKNILRQKTNLPHIILREKDLNYLKTQRINLSQIYPNNFYLPLQLGCDLDIGGERVRIERDTVPQENIDLFTKASKTLGLRFSGIDFITPDIMTPYAQISTAINEINSAPDSDVHYRDTYPYENYAAERILKKLFEQKTEAKRERPAIQPFIQLLPSLASSSETIQIN